MGHPRIRVLFVEDDDVDRMAFERFVKKQGLSYAYTCASSVEEGRKALESDRFDVVITDFMLGDGTAFKLFDAVPPDVPIVIVTGVGHEEIAVQAMKSGASDYLTKDPDSHYLKMLPITVDNAIKSKRAERALQDAREELERRVEERTAELKRVNEQLLLEIAERKRAEEKYRSIFENAVEGIFQTTPGGRFLSANPAMARIHGYDSAEELIETIADIGRQMYVHPERRSEFLGLMREGKTVQRFEVHAYRKDGAQIWVSMDARPIYDRDGTLMYCEGMVQDITEHKQAEEALRESEERYRSLVDNIDIGVTLIRTDHAIVMTNPARAKMFGKSPAELIGRKCFQEFREQQTICDNCPVPRAATAGQPAEVDIESVKVDGSRINLRMRVFPIFGHDGAVAGHIEIAEDITERVRIEEQLRQAAKMEAVGQLAGGVAHDFNNLLTAILGYSDMLLQEMPETDQARQRVSQIFQGAQRAAHLTRQLLAFSRKQVLDVKQLDVNAVIADLSTMLQRLIGENIELRTVYRPSLGKVVADPGQIEQILINLAVNARDAMQRGGKLTIETDNVFLDAMYARSHPEVRPGPYVTIVVTDTGCGMPPEIQSRVFEPFFTTKEKDKGTGLGLSMVYGIVKQHRGHVTVYSEADRGSTFRLYWPITAGSEAPVEAAPIALERQIGTETLLVVEDEDIVRDLTCEILEMLGYKVLRAGNPEEALKVSTDYEQTIHLLLTDLVMPKMDGSSLFARLSPTRPDMKVVYMSGYTENFIVHHGVLDPGVDFLQKPFTGDILAAKVRSVLDSPRAAARSGWEKRV